WGGSERQTTAGNFDRCYNKLNRLFLYLGLTSIVKLHITPDLVERKALTGGGLFAKIRKNAMCIRQRWRAG
ncbi:MAG: hypothetical protein LUF91_01820, partial [Oscillospiraceae bacterium]|nr:hypothetical protein [Oscillospiraceae bacterium]